MSVFAIVLAFIVLLGWPGSAYAGVTTAAHDAGEAFEVCVQQGSPSATVSASIARKVGKAVALRVRGKKAGDSKVSYSSLYKPVLKSAVARTGDFSEFGGAPWTYYVRKYTLYDINHDGIKELIVHVGYDGKAFRGVYVYTIKGGAAKLAGTFAPGYGCVVASSKGKLYVYVNASVAQNYTLLSMKGSKVVGKVVCEEYFRPPYSNEKIRAFEKKAGLSGWGKKGKDGLVWSDIAKHSLLKRAGKVK